jgi:hypothetical protein
MRPSGYRAGPSAAFPEGAGSAPRDGEERVRSEGVVNNVAEFGEGLLTLAELQARLAVVELRQNVAAAKAGGSIILAGGALALASLALVLVGLAELLVSELGMKRGYALLAVAGAGLVTAGACIALAARHFQGRSIGFPVSGEELARNLNWVKTVLRHSGRPPSRR